MQEVSKQGFVLISINQTFRNNCLLFCDLNFKIAINHKI